MACVLWAYSVINIGLTETIHFRYFQFELRSVSPIIQLLSRGECELQKDLNDMDVNNRLVSGIGRAFTTRHGLSLHVSR